MTDLIERIEGAGEGSRELDAAIADQLKFWPVGFVRKDFHGGDRRWCDDVRLVGRRPERIDCPAYTDDVSTALAMIPEGWLLHFLQDTEFDNPEERHWSVSLRPRQGKWDGTPEGSEVQAFAATPALALCAAALKSRTTAAGGGE